MGDRPLFYQTGHALSELGLSDACSVEDLNRFIRFCRVLRQEIILYTSVNTPETPPEDLPEHVMEFLAKVFDHHDSYIRDFWKATKEIVWSSGDEPVLLSKLERQLFSRFGPQALNANHKLSTFKINFCLHAVSYFKPDLSVDKMLYPQVRTCTTQTCEKKGKPLSEPVRHSIVLYSLQGASAAYTTSLYCRSESSIIFKL